MLGVAGNGGGEAQAAARRNAANAALRMHRAYTAAAPQKRGRSGFPFDLVIEIALAGRAATTVPAAPALRLAEQLAVRADDGEVDAAPALATLG